MIDPNNNAKTLTADQQIILLRNRTERHHNLHEAQANQLRVWPIYLDRRISSVHAAPDFDEHEISYTWQGPPLDHDRCVRLERNIKWMLGEQWSINITVKGRRIFPDTNPVQRFGIWARLWAWVRRTINGPKLIAGR